VLASATSSAAVSVRQPLTLTPAGAVDGWYAYALDIRSRVELLPTFATLLDEPRSPVDIIADPVRGVLVFTTTAATVDRARDDIQLAVADAEATLRSTIGYQQYSLQTVGSMRVFDVQQRSPIATISAISIGAGATLVTGLGLLRAARRRAEPALDQATPQEATSVP
ncbi:MAG: polymerase, partial [Mycobacterium sp.]